MLNLRKIIFKDNKEQTLHPFLCDKIKEFGFCEGSCLKRHVLCKTLDKECLNMPTKCFIKIQLTKVLSTSHYYGRILKYSAEEDPTKNEDWISVDDSFEFIEHELEKYMSLQNNQIVQTTPIIGEMVMIETKKKFFRGVVLDIVYRWFATKVKVKLIDLGFTEEIHPNKVFLLPNHLKQFRPVSVEIIISSMEAIEEREGTVFNWPTTTTNIVKSLLEPFILENLTFTCKVEFILGITLWVDWLLAKKCFKCSHFVCKLYKNSIILPKELIDRNLAKTSSRIIDKIIDLSKDAHIWKEQINDKSLNLKKTDISLFSCEEQEPKIDEVIKVQWAHLSEDIIFNVFICNMTNPKCFLVYNLKFNEQVNALQKDIDTAINNKTVQKLNCASVGMVCLAISPDQMQYNRVSIQQINDETAVVLYVDFGEICKVKIEYLLTIPSILITKLPFQVIECNLSGFNNILETDVVDKFIDDFLKFTSKEMYLKVLSSSVDTTLTGGNSYEVVLFNNDTNVNITLAHAFNMYVDNTQIQTILNSNYKYNEYVEHKNNNDGCENQDDEDIDIEIQMELLKSLMNNSNNTNEKQLELNNSTSLNQDCTENNKQNKYVTIKNNFCLDCNVTPIIPQCFWHQDNKWVFLKLNILSAIDYEITHTIRTITITAKTNSANYFFTVILYVSIKEELFSYRVNFDGIHIKAQKLIICEDKWPRLLKCPKKHKYIIYDIEYIDNRKDLQWFTELNKYKLLYIGHPLTTNEVPTDDSDSDSEEFSVFED